jgi:predicted nucleic acid-binding protein
VFKAWPRWVTSGDDSGSVALTDGKAHRIFPDESTLGLFFEWMDHFRLGRKRILDTFLAATYVSHGIRRILSTDAEGFRLFGALEVLHP